MYLSPTGYYAMTAGTPIPVESIVLSETHYNTGQILLSPVAFYARAVTPPRIISVDASPIILLRALLDSNAQIRSLDELRDPETSADEYEQQQQRTRMHAQQVPLIVALTHANQSYELRSEGIRITHVFNDSPAKDVLHTNDIITHVNGNTTHIIEDLVSQVQSSTSGVNLTLLRDDVPRNVFASTREGRLGIRVQNHNLTLVHDAPLRVDLGAVGGSSGDILVALEAYSILTQTDLVKGRIISGSGSLTASGDVRDVRGITLKAQAAKRSGAELFLAPSTAEEFTVDGLEIIRVSTFQEALNALNK